MKLAIKTCTLDMPYEQMLDFCVEQKIAAIEIGTGNWSGAPHCDLDLLVSDKTAREKWYDAMREKGLELCALNCSGNPLAYEKDMDVTKKTFELAHQLGVKKIVMMSGLPVGCEGDKTPVWITTSWPPETQDILDYQWNQVAIPAWKKLVKLAEDCGIERIALENHGMQLVYNPETLLRLREAVGPMIGMNLDPSHLFWMGGDPIEAARVLGEHGAIYHIHGKDSAYAAALFVEMVSAMNASPARIMADLTARFGAFEMADSDFSYPAEQKPQLTHLLFEQKALPAFDRPVRRVSYEDGCKVYFEDGGFVVCRFSGTEPLLRFCAEADTKEKALASIQAFKDMLKL